MRARTRLRLLGVAMLLVAFFVGFGLITTRTWLGDTVDYQVWSAILNGLPGWLRLPLDRFARDVAPVGLAVVAGVLFLVGLARRHWRPVLAGLVVATVPVILTAPVHLQDASGPVGGSYPSNHATAGLGLLAAVIVLWPTRVRRGGLAAAAGLAFVLCLGNVSWYAHAPRDVAGSVLVVVGVIVATVAGFGVDVLNLAARRNGNSAGGLGLRS